LFASHVDGENDQLIHDPLFSWVKQAYEGEYEDDEFVGFDEEKTYLPKENLELEVVVVRVPLGTLDAPNSYDPQHVARDDETLLANKVASIYIHDKKTFLELKRVPHFLTLKHLTLH
jgi:hypothetical protein